MRKGKQTDWFGFWLHFACGAIFGGLIGFWVWGRPLYDLHDSAVAGIICIVGGSVVGGLLAGLAREDFWGRF